VRLRQFARQSEIESHGFGVRQFVFEGVQKTCEKAHGVRRSSAPVYNILAHWRTGSRAPCSPYQRASLRQSAPVPISQLAHPPFHGYLPYYGVEARSLITAVHLIKAIVGSAGFLSSGVARSLSI
jgi:hypothetical protein